MSDSFDLNKNLPKRPVPILLPDSFTKKKENSFLSSSIHTPVVNRISNVRRRRYSLEGPDNLSLTSLDTSLYIKTKEESYFEQCFTLIGCIDIGSYSEVLKAKSKIDNQIYAVKVIKTPRLGKDSPIIKECRYLERASPHPNVVQFTSAWRECGEAYLCTSLCICNFAVILSTEPIRQNELYIFMGHILSGLSHLHALGIVHLDIKCQNILLGYDGYYKIADFGLSFSSEQDDPSFAVEGDARYMASELLDNIVSTSADVFSLGMIVIEAVFNIELPSDGNLWHQLRRGDYSELNPEREYPDIIFELMGLMTSFKPANRPTAEEVLMMLNIVNPNEKTSSLTSAMIYKLEQFTRYASTPFVKGRVVRFRDDGSPVNTFNCSYDSQTNDTEE